MGERIRDRLVLGELPPLGIRAAYERAQRIASSAKGKPLAV